MYVRERDDFEILLINDASTEKKDYEGNIAWWQKQVDNPHKIRYHCNEKNLGFGGSMNLGVYHAKGDIIVLYSDDVVLSGNFLPSLMEKMQDGVLVGGEVLTHDTGWNVLNDVVIPYANGWFLSCTKYTWNILGGFDPIYEKFDAEDLDLSTMAHYKGIKLVALNSPYLYHIGGATIGSVYSDRVEYSKKHIQLWQNKWKDKTDILRSIIYGKVETEN
jgi:GT2 family glycosyltransferase